MEWAIVVQSLKCLLKSVMVNCTNWTGRQAIMLKLFPNTFSLLYPSLRGFIQTKSISEYLLYVLSAMLPMRITAIVSGKTDSMFLIIQERRFFILADNYRQKITADLSDKIAKIVRRIRYT